MGIKYSQNKEIDENLAVKMLSSGAKCYIIPKCDTTQIMAAVAFNYGSSDIRFKTDEVFSSPEGIAHFIEHKLFEQKWGNAFEELNSKGVNVNAFTDFNKTAYYFSVSENFDECFETLLKFVQSPYFEEESVEREKGIIAQEILMYEDDNDWQATFNMLKGMYFYHEAKNNIAGTVKSIGKIKKADLYNCYNAFYRPENMVIVVCGNVDVEKVIETSEKLIVQKDGLKASTLHREEPDCVKEKTVIKKEEVTVPMWCFGFKQKPYKPDLKEIYGTKILMDIVYGKGSKFCDRMFKSVFLEEPPALQYMYGKGYNACVLSGVSKSPHAIADAIRQEITEIIKNGIEFDDFNSVKRKHIGRFIRGFNSVDAICMSQLEIGMDGYDLFEAYECIKQIDKKFLEILAEEKFEVENTIFSVIDKR